MVRLMFVAVVLGAVVPACATGTTASQPARSVAALGCDDLPASLRSGESFAAPLSVVGVRQLHEVMGRQQTGVAKGAELHVRASHDLDVVAVRRVVMCRAEASRAAGSTSDPLAVAGARVQVDPRGGGFVVRVTANTRASSREIADRASRLAQQ